MHGWVTPVVTMAKPQKHRPDMSRIERRLRTRDPRWLTSGDMIPCWCHGKWEFPYSWRGMVKS